MFDIQERQTFSDTEKLLFNIWQELRFISGLQVALLNDNVIPEVDDKPKAKKKRKDDLNERNDTNG